MRIIGGELKGRIIKTAKGAAIRPTSDKTREAIFDVLQKETGDKTVLDVFAGSGALGIEALSRGARFATFVDDSISSVTIIKENIEKLGLSDRAEVFRLKVPQRLKLVKTSKIKSEKRIPRKYDLIFLDPPYNKGLITPTIEELIRLDLIAQNIIIVAEHFVHEEPGKIFDDIRLTRRKVYSTTVVSFYER